MLLVCSSFRKICNKIPRDSMLMFDNNAKTVDLNIPSLSYDNSRINRGIEENYSSMHRKQSLEIAIFYMRNAYFFRKRRL